MYSLAGQNQISGRSISYSGQCYSIKQYNCDESCYVQTALAYAVDSNGLPGGIGRLYTMPTAENKGDIAELKALVDELNAASKSFALPQSVVYHEGIQISYQKVNTEVVVAQPTMQSEVKAEAQVLNPTEVIAGGSYIRPFYM